MDAQILQVIHIVILIVMKQYVNMIHIAVMYNGIQSVLMQQNVNVISRMVVIFIVSLIITIIMEMNMVIVVNMVIMMTGIMAMMTIVIVMRYVMEMNLKNGNLNMKKYHHALSIIAMNN